MPIPPNETPSAYNNRVVAEMRTMVERYQEDLMSGDPAKMQDALKHLDPLYNDAYFYAEAALAVIDERCRPPYETSTI